MMKWLNHFHHTGSKFKKKDEDKVPLLLFDTILCKELSNYWSIVPVIDFYIHLKSL